MKILFRKDEAIFPNVWSETVTYDLIMFISCFWSTFYFHLRNSGISWIMDMELSWNDYLCFLFLDWLFLRTLIKNQAFLHHGIQDLKNCSAVHRHGVGQSKSDISFGIFYFGILSLTIISTWSSAWLQLQLRFKGPFYSLIKHYLQHCSFVVTN